MIENKTVIRYAKVLSVMDDQAGLRIKVRLPEDATAYPRDEDLPYCFPLLPKHIHLNPKIGECVLIILAKLNNTNSQRFFIGPLISQQYALNYDSDRRSRCLLVDGTSVKPLPRPNMNPDNEGTYPDREDIALQGRQNTDIILKDNEVRIRCGFKRYPNGAAADTLLFNKEDLGYIQMRYKRSKDQNNKDYSSAINIVADRINLLSHDSSGHFTLNDPKKLITDEEMLKILKTAHPLPYGDVLVGILKFLFEFIRTHTHSMSMLPPCVNVDFNKLFEKRLGDLLSQSIRIN